MLTARHLSNKFWSHSEEKVVTRIRLLDPACGTMHFGHYAMEVFDAMYRDARDWGAVTIEDHRIPTAILEHNLFGVDIDRRAVQLAALSLFMKARTMHPQARVRQVNLVVADATLPDSGVKEKFLKRYAHDKRLQKAVAQVLDDMDNVAQVGSLLRVEERLRELLTEAGHAVVEGFDPRRQGELPGMAPDTRQLGLAELAEEEHATEWIPHHTLQELRDDLRIFAREALQEHDVNAQLFATEADKAVRLLDVLMGDYDVVVMNPPYGGTTEAAKQQLKRSYPRTWSDLYGAFFERASEFTSRGGYIGALTSRTFMYLSTFQTLREEVMLEYAPPIVILDLGFEVLDGATVETCATVLKSEEEIGSSGQCRFFRLNTFDEEREQIFAAALRQNRHREVTLSVDPNEFGHLPGSPFAYWAPTSLRRIVKELPPFQPLAGQAIVGLQTGHDAQFVRHWWEVPQGTTGKGRKWAPFAKGGDYSKYYYDIDLVVDWDENGNAIKHFYGPGDRLRSRPQNESYYFQEGLTYTYMTVKGFNARYMPAGTIFSVGGPGIIPNAEVDLWQILG